MDELAIATYPERVTRHDTGVAKYPIIIDSQRIPGVGGWKPRDHAMKEGLWVRHDTIEKILNDGAPDGCAVLAPTYLDIILTQIEKNNQAQKKWEDMSYARRAARTHDYQITYYKGSKIGFKGQIDLWGFSLHADSTFMESLIYDYYPIEGRQCDHTCIDEWLNQHYQKISVIMQPAAFMLKETYQFMIKAEVEWESVGANELTARGEKVKVTKDLTRHMNEKWDRYDAQNNVKMRKRHLRMLVAGSKAQMLQDERVKKEYQSILDAANKWNKEFKDIEVGKICYWMSCLARAYSNHRETFEENQQVSSLFQEKMRSNFKEGNKESRIIRNIKHNAEVTFAALVLISACDAVQTKVTWETPYVCCRGALIFAESLMGDAYHFLRDELTWSVRMSYYPKYKEEEVNQYLYRRVNLFNQDIKKGTDLIIWQSKPFPVENYLHINTGYTCQKFEVEGDITHWPDNQKYSKVIERIINDEISVESITTADLHHNLTNIYEMDVTKDTYLNKDGDLYLPSYMDKEVVCPLLGVVEKCEYMTVDTEPDKDIWHQRLSKAFLHGFEELHLHPIPSHISENHALMGGSLEHRQDGTKYFKHVTGRVKEIYDEDVCTIQAMSEIVPRHLYERIFSTVKYQAPMYIIQQHIKDYYKVGKIDCWDQTQHIRGCKTMSQFLFYMLGYVIEGKVMRYSELESRIKHQQLIANDLHWMDGFPTLQRIMKFEEKCTVQDTFAYNIIMLMKLAYRNIILKQTHFYFLVYTDEVRIDAIPARFCTLWTLVRILRFHPGAVERTRILNDVEWVLFTRLMKNITTQKQTTIHEGLRTVDSKEMPFRIYAGSLCNGVSEMVMMVRAIVHPRPGLVVFAIADNQTDVSVIERRMLRYFKSSKKSILGYVIVRIVSADSLECSGWGVCRTKNVVRTYMKLTHEIVIIKTRGCVLGNEELMSKIMSRGGR
nr:Outer capsid protein [Tibet orbivirus]